MKTRHYGAHGLCALMISLALSACGSGGGSGGGTTTPDNNNGGGGNTEDQFTIGGTVTGADGSITLSLNGSQESFNGVEFTFTNTLTMNAAYSVGFVSADNGQSCTVQNASGSVSANVTDIAVTCSPLASELRFTDGSPYGPLTIGDYNGDGHADMVIGIKSNENHSSGANNYFLRIMTGNGVGGFTQATEYNKGLIYFTEGEHFPLVSGDLNNDASDDFLAITVGNVERYLGQVSDDPEKATDVIAYWNNLKTLFTLDMTGDGNEDIVSFNYQVGNAAMDYFVTIPGNGDGTFGDVIGSGSLIETNADPDLSALGFRGASTMTIGDFNGDGLTDIISLNSNSGDDVVMLGFWAGTGDGRFSYPSALQALPQDLHVGESTFNQEASSRPLGSGDVDLDGDIDVVIGSTDDFVLILHNDGSGNFSVADRITMGDYPVSVKLVDLNLDGNLDIVSANAQSRTLGISWGQADGSFGERGDDEALFTERKLDNETQFGSLLVFDIDESGYLDILYAESETNKDGFADGSVQIILNPGM